MACVGILEQSTGSWNRVGIELSYRPARLGGIDSLKSIPGLHQCLKIWALFVQVETSELERLPSAQAVQDLITTITYHVSQ